MSGYISFFVFCFISIIGLITVFKIIYQSMAEKTVLTLFPFIILTKENSSKVEYIVRSALIKTDGYVVVINKGMDNESKEILYRLKNENNRIVIK